MYSLQEYCVVIFSLWCNQLWVESPCVSHEEQYVCCMLGCCLCSVPNLSLMSVALRFTCCLTRQLAVIESHRCLNSVLIVSVSLFLSICPPLWTSISSSTHTHSAGKHIFYSSTISSGLIRSGKITIHFQQMIQKISSVLILFQFSNRVWQHKSKPNFLCFCDQLHR